VRLDWRVLAPPPFLPAVFVHVYDAAGALVAQSDGPPADGFAPLELWRPGDGLVDERTLDLSALPPGDYSVAVGVYDPANGARLAAEADGVRLANDVLTVATFKR
jgi:anti-sigma-K factor RskA